MVDEEDNVEDEDDDLDTGAERWCPGQLLCIDRFLEGVQWMDDFFEILEWTDNFFEGLECTDNFLKSEKVELRWWFVLVDLVICVLVST